MPYDTITRSNTISFIYHAIDFVLLIIVNEEQIVDRFHAYALITAANFCKELLQELFIFRAKIDCVYTNITRLENLLRKSNGRPEIFEPA